MIRASLTLYLVKGLQIFEKQKTYRMIKDKDKVKEYFLL